MKHYYITFTASIRIRARSFVCDSATDHAPQHRPQLPVATRHCGAATHTDCLALATYFHRKDAKGNAAHSVRDRLTAFLFCLFLTAFFFSAHTGSPALATRHCGAATYFHRKDAKGNAAHSVRNRLTAFLFYSLLTAFSFLPTLAVLYSPRATKS
ncbi:MAG: hypothetical protein IJV69_00990, partial [Kiritimatiellae bacterium]|nr:hypothetical protein [Kiritimatiellia bacterium]